MTTIDRITKRIDELKKSTCTKSIVDELERVKAELTAVNGVDELIQVPICNDCHKPHYGRMKAEDRCQCDTSGNFTMGDIIKEQDETLKDSQPKEVTQSISREAVEKLRNQRQKEINNIGKYDIVEHEQGYYEGLVEGKQDEIKDLDQLLISNP